MKTYTLAALIILSICAGSSVSWADREISPFPYVITADGNGRFYFKMIPDPADPYARHKGSGTCFEVTGGETDTPLWNTTGWYSFEAHLSRDGVYLVRVDSSPRGHDVSAGSHAVAFYKNGNLVKSYSTKDLVKDASAMTLTVSHYGWLAEAPIFEGGTLKIRTKDHIEYTFDITSGEILPQQ